MPDPRRPEVLDSKVNKRKISIISTKDEYRRLSWKEIIIKILFKKNSEQRGSSNWVREQIPILILNKACPNPTVHFINFWLLLLKLNYYLKSKIVIN